MYPFSSNTSYQNLLVHPYFVYQEFAETITYYLHATTLASRYSNSSQHLLYIRTLFQLWSHTASSEITLGTKYQNKIYAINFLESEMDLLSALIKVNRLIKAILHDSNEFQLNAFKKLVCNGASIKEFACFGLRFQILRSEIKDVAKKLLENEKLSSYAAPSYLKILPKNVHQLLLNYVSGSHEEQACKMAKLKSELIKKSTLESVALNPLAWDRANKLKHSRDSALSCEQDLSLKIIDDHLFKESLFSDTLSQIFHS